jgi:hypothetical protein
MNKIIFLVSVAVVFTLLGAGCVEIVAPEESPVAVPSGDVKAPTAEEIGTVDDLSDGDEGEELSVGDELDALVEEIEGLEAEADGMLDDLKNIDGSQDNNLNI